MPYNSLESLSNPLGKTPWRQISIAVPTTPPPCYSACLDGCTCQWCVSVLDAIVDIKSPSRLNRMEIIAIGQIILAAVMLLNSAMCPMYFHPENAGFYFGIGVILSSLTVIGGRAGFRLYSIPLVTNMVVAFFGIIVVGNGFQNVHLALTHDILAEMDGVKVAGELDLIKDLLTPVQFAKVSNTAQSVFAGVIMLSCGWTVTLLYATIMARKRIGDPEPTMV